MMTSTAKQMLLRFTILMIAFAVGQLVLLPFGLGDAKIFVGLCLGAGAAIISERPPRQTRRRTWPEK